MRSLARQVAFVVCFWQVTTFCQLRASAQDTANGAAAITDTSAAVTFETDILPLFRKHCLACHGDGKLSGGLDLRRKFLVVKGGDSGPALIDGRPDESLLLARIESGEMPPPEADTKLEEADRALMRQWVATGAPLKFDSEPPLDEGEIRTRVSEADRDFWAFQTPQRPPIPHVMSADRVRTPIDAFLLARLEANGLSFNPDAPKATLLRRVYFDVLGEPPTPEQLAEFLADERPNAYEVLVDRLLSDPRYGERWGRHWLDIAGYADSDGYLAADRLRPEAWRYRDYVIEAHNRDLPYDQFVTQQLAGDELSDWRRADQLSPESIRQLTATGFLRTASDPTYPGYTEPNEIHQVLSDTVQIVGSAFFGLTIQCARCHSHKYDPIPQYDYYALQAIFLPALDPAHWQPSEVRGIPLATEAEQAQINQRNQKVDARLNELASIQSELTTRFQKQELVEHFKRQGQELTVELTDKLLSAFSVAEDKRSDEQKALVAKYAQILKLSEQDLAAQHADYKHELDQLKAAIAAEKALKKQITVLRGLSDLESPPPSGHILRRGDYNQLGAAVEPAVPEVLTNANYTLAAQPTYKTTGRRAGLARWLTDPAHPLTARVEVNRMWAHHFGRGIVRTTANFGHSGSPPTHPELLDWLATEFVREGWSMKSMHRLMLTSTAYRQASGLDEKKIAIDPENLMWGAWQPRRHEGEVLRDSTLAVSGKLNPKMFGPPAPVAPQDDGSVTASDDADGNRRSVYLIVRRSQHLTMLDLFDTPMMEINCPERNVSTVPLQALAMLHSSFAETAAKALADRILSSCADDQARLEYAYRLLFARDITDHERETIVKFLDAIVKEDATGDAVAAHRRAWEQLALVLLNSNEFVYVD